MTRFDGREIKVLVVEEQEIFQELYRIVFAEPSEGITLSACCTPPLFDAHRISQQIADSEPDVLVIGLKTLEKRAISLLQDVRKSFPRLGTVVMAGTCNPEDVKLARKFASFGGGMALYLKQSFDSLRDLCGIVRSVACGQVILDPAIVGLLFAERPEYPFAKQLTARELEILGLVAHGYTNSAIAEKIFTDIKTVENHINTLYAKLRVEEDMDQRNPRVMATRVYLSATDLQRPVLSACIA